MLLAKIFHASTRQPRSTRSARPEPRSQSEPPLVTSKVLSEDLDAAIIIQPYFVVPKTCGWRVLREEPLVVLAPASMMTSEPHILLARELYIRYSRDQWCGHLIDARFKLDALDVPGPARFG